MRKLWRKWERTVIVIIVETVLGLIATRSIGQVVDQGNWRSGGIILLWLMIVASVPVLAIRLQPPVPEIAEIVKSQIQEMFSPQYPAPVHFELATNKEYGVANDSKRYDIRAVLDVRNLGKSAVRDCTVRLVDMRHSEQDRDGHLAFPKTWVITDPLYLEWSQSDGGGKTHSFAKQARAHVALLAATNWDSGRYSLQLADHALMDKYILEDWRVYYCEIEVLAGSGECETSHFTLAITGAWADEPHVTWERTSPSWLDQEPSS